MLNFILHIVVIYASKRWRQGGTSCIFHSRYKLNFAGL